MKRKKCHSFLSDEESLSMDKLPNGTAAYIYGYPLVMTGITEEVAISNIPTPSNGSATINQIGKQTEFPSVEFSAVVLPSTSTLYVSAFLNLRKEPMILHIPDFGDRFFQMPILDGWTNVNRASPSTRLGSLEGEFVLVGPNDPRDYSGGGRVVIKMDTDTAWMVGRVFTDASDKDLVYIRENLYPYLTLTPWSKRNDPDYKPPADLPIDPFIEMFGNPILSLQNMDAVTFFTKLAAMMNYNAPNLPRDKKIVKRLIKIGFTFDDGVVTFKLREKHKDQLESEVAKAKAYLDLPPLSAEVFRTGWTFPTEVQLAEWGDNYKFRAKIARWAMGANPVQDVIYGYARVDSNHGKNKYTITFDSLPPAGSKAFWSVTIYNSDGSLVYNQAAIDAGVNYNAIGIPTVQEHKPILHNRGKSITLYLQSKVPKEGTVAFQNWLPTPSQRDSLGSKNFIVFLRIYIPQLETKVNGKPKVVDGKYIPKDNWFPGEIKKVNKIGK